MKPCQARALVFTTWRTCQAHALFSPTCEVIMLIHSLFSPTCEFTRLMHSFSPSGIKLMHFYHQLLNLSGLCTFFSSPPCELIRLMHSFCHHRVNLSSSCSCFHHRVNLSSSCTPFSPPCELISLMHSFSDCWHSDLYPTHARTLWFYGTEWKVPGDTATTKTMWYRNLAWSTRLGKISNQINLHYSSICKA